MAFGDRQASRDITPTPLNSGLQGMTSDGTHVWLTDYSRNKCFAYKLSDGSYASSQDFNTIAAPISVYTDGTYIWVLGFGATVWRAYRIGDKRVISSQNLPLNTASTIGNTKSQGMWSDESFFYVVDNVANKVFLYNKRNKVHNRNYSLNSLNSGAIGIWSDGTTAWVSDRSRSKMFAYRLSDFVRDTGKEFDLRENSANIHAHNTWSDGNTIWVVDDARNKVFAYELLNLDSLSDLESPHWFEIVFNGHTYNQLYLGSQLYWEGGTPPVITSFRVDRNNLDLDTATGNIELIVQGTGFTEGRIINQNTGEVVQNFATTTGVSRASTPIPQEVTVYVVTVSNSRGSISQELTVNVTKNPLLTNFRSLGALPSQGNQRHFRFAATLEGVPQPTMSADQGIGTITPRHLTKTGPGIWNLEFDHVFGVAGSRRVTLTITNSSGSDAEFVDIVVP